MNVVIAIDSFKGCFSSMEAGNAAKEGILNVYPDADIKVRPLADGGEGTVEALIWGMDGKKVTIQVTGPLGEKVEASYGIVTRNKEEKTAIIEMSAAAGITLVEKTKRNPLKTTTYGVGEMIKDAILKGCRFFLVGIGGSATNDGGIGMLQALGFSILDQDGKQVSFGAAGLEKICSITDKEVMKELKECSFKIACDVTNPLCGPEGCSFVFAPQKGATSRMVMQMDGWMENYAAIAKQMNPLADAKKEGAGAAGGLGFAFLTFLNGKLESGTQIVFEETRLEEYIKQAEFVITGEGQLDGQTIMGKAPIGVAELAKKHEKIVLAFAGGVQEKANQCNNHGIDAFFPILRNVVTLEEAMNFENAKRNLKDAVEQTFRLIKTVDDFKNKKLSSFNEKKCYDISDTCNTIDKRNKFKLN